MSNPDNSLVKLLGTPTRSLDTQATESGDSCLRSLSDLFEMEDDEGGLDVFGESRSDIHAHSDNDDDDEGKDRRSVRSKESTVKLAHEKWQGSCRSFDRTDDDLLNLSASLSDLCASFTDLMSRNRGQFQKYHRTGPAKLSNMTLQHEIQRLAKTRQDFVLGYQRMG